jgi:hypothetical protein
MGFHIVYGLVIRRRICLTIIVLIRKTNLLDISYYGAESPGHDLTKPLIYVQTHGNIKAPHVLYLWLILLSLLSAHNLRVSHHALVTVYCKSISVIL